MNPLRIGIDGRNLGPTGIGRYTRELTLALAKEYPKVMWHLIVNDENAGYIDSSLVSLRNIITNKVRAGYYSVAEQLKLSQELDALNLDLVHFTNFNAPFGLKTPFVATVHDLTLLFFPGRRMWPGKRWFYRQVLKNSLRKSRAIITASKDASLDIKRFATENKIRGVRNKVEVIAHGVSAVFKVKSAEKTAIANPYFLIVGAQLPHKNVHRVLIAFAMAQDESWAQAFKVVIAGTKTDPAPHMDKVWRQFPALRDRVDFTGPVTDSQLRSLYQGATALIFASQKEGFGLPILEAFMSECPVIASKISSIPEVAGESAWYINPKETASIVEAMRKVALGGKAVSAKVKSGQTRVARYNWLKAAKETYDVYQNITQ